MRPWASFTFCELGEKPCGLLLVLVTFMETITNWPCAFLVRYGLSPTLASPASTPVTVNSNFPSRTAVLRPATFGSAFCAAVFPAVPAAVLPAFALSVLSPPPLVTVMTTRTAMTASTIHGHLRFFFAFGGTGCAG